MQEGESKNFKIVFEHIGEGYNGEYNPKDPNDRPLLRCDIYKKDNLDETIEDGSFCTNIIGITDVSPLIETMLDHLEELLANGSSLSKPMGLYSWYSEKDDFSQRP